MPGGLLPDETGLRSHDARGRSYAPRGRTPLVRVNPKRAGRGLIAAVTNKGERRWIVLDGAIKAVILLGFLARLIREAGRKVCLILAACPVHRSVKVKAWLASRASHRAADIKVFYLPPYSPELNLDEGLNSDRKQTLTGRSRRSF